MEHWQDKAWCRLNLLPGDAIELYFQPTKSWEFFNALVQNTCARCEVRVECLAHGIKTDSGTSQDRTGIFGGLTVNHRTKVKNTSLSCVCSVPRSRCLIHTEAPDTKSSVRAETMLFDAMNRKKKADGDRNSNANQA